MGRLTAWQLGCRPRFLKRLHIYEVGKLAENKKILEDAIKALEEYYVEYGQGRDIKYAFGFFDALAVLRGMVNANAPVRDFGH